MEEASWKQLVLQTASAIRILFSLRTVSGNLFLISRTYFLISFFSIFFTEIDNRSVFFLD